MRGEGIARIRANVPRWRHRPGRRDRAGRATTQAGSILRRTDSSAGSRGRGGPSSRCRGHSAIAARRTSPRCRSRGNAPRSVEDPPPTRVDNLGVLLVGALNLPHKTDVSRLEDWVAGPCDRFRSALVHRHHLGTLLASLCTENKSARDRERPLSTDPRAPPDRVAYPTAWSWRPDTCLRTGVRSTTPASRPSPYSATDIAGRAGRNRLILA
jgi:hypothetical protein